MKALEVLKKVSVFSEHSKHYPSFDDFNEAIAELEALESRSCENCKYNKEQDGFMIYCEKEMCKDGSKMMWHSFTKDFCCKYWESR